MDTNYLHVIIEIVVTINEIISILILKYLCNIIEGFFHAQNNLYPFDRAPGGSDRSSIDLSLTNGV